MLSDKEFDLWANDYDKSVNLSQEANVYPFAGYKDVLNTVYKTVHKMPSSESPTVLDIGFGTAVLTKKLYSDGINIFGVDFSEKMIEIARKKMPNANLLKCDFKNGLPKELHNKKFDFIISTYAIHHLDDSEKVTFINELLTHLNLRGKIVIGDVAFKTRNELNSCKKQSKKYWDFDEVYIVFDEFIKNFENVKITFKKISNCAGIIVLEK